MKDLLLSNKNIEVPTTYTDRLVYLDEQSQCIKPIPDYYTPAILKELYEALTKTRAMDTKAVNLQRTGLMSTYPSSRGQEAIGVGIGHAMLATDVFCPYYRDQGAFLLRNVPIADIYSLWGGDERGNLFPNNNQDLPICVPIACQYLHATGVAFAIKHRQENRAVVTTGGDGSTSKGDFYEAINLAGAWNLPVVFVINNNQWAISVPRTGQSNSQTISQKAIAAGFRGIQVDGNDVIAVRESVSQALEKARNGGGPTLIEAVSYRLCDHTTADDATRYQPSDEVKQAWEREPVIRLANYLESLGEWSKQQEAELQEKVKAAIEEDTEKYLNRIPQDKNSMFTYLYQNMPDVLLDQIDELGEQ